MNAETIPRIIVAVARSRGNARNAAGRVNAIRGRLGLPPHTGPNGSSVSAEASASDIPTAIRYFERVIDACPAVPRKQDVASVRAFILEIVEWDNFVLAAYHRFADMVARDRFGERGSGMLFPLNNILAAKNQRLGVDHEMVVRPDNVSAKARGWTSADRARSTAAMAEAQRALADVVAADMRRFLPSEESGRPPLSAAAKAIADLVWEQGPLTAKELANRLPAGPRVSEAQVRRIFSDVLTPHYGFTNLRDRTGYRAPAERTW